MLIEPRIQVKPTPGCWDWEHRIGRRAQVLVRMNDCNACFSVAREKWAKATRHPDKRFVKAQDRAQVVVKRLINW
jgi:hypothetical protein